MEKGFSTECLVAEKEKAKNCHKLTAEDSKEVEVEVIARLSVCDCDPGCGCQILPVTALMLSSGCSSAGQGAGVGKDSWDKAGNQFLCARRRVASTVCSSCVQILNTLLQLALSAAPISSASVWVECLVFSVVCVLCAWINPDQLVHCCDVVCCCFDSTSLVLRLCLCLCSQFVQFIMVALFVVCCCRLELTCN